MNRLALSVLVVACLALVGGPRGWASEAGREQAPGPHAVGFRVVQQVDRSREFRQRVDPVTGEPVLGERGRPVQTLIWYPATAPGKPLRYRDYLATRLTESNFERTPVGLKAAAEKQAAGLVRRLGPAGAQILEGAVAATLEAPAAPGPFPVVLYAPGVGGTADENAHLCEALASHGYLVVACTSLGPIDKTVDYAMEGVEPQLRDLQYLIGYVHGLPEADARRIAVMGWSWGGLVNVFAAARDARIGAIVSLDGTREPALTKRIDVRRLTVPWLYFSRTPDTIPEINRSGIDTTFSLLNEAKYAAVTQVILYPMSHADFTSARLREANPAAYGDYSREEVRQAFTVMVSLTRTFLDAHLKGDAGAAKALEKDPREFGAAPHTVRILRGPGPQAPPTRLHLVETLAREGFPQAVAVVQAMQAREPGFTLPPEELQAWGYALLAQGRAADACGIFRLWTMLHPQDWNAFDSLGEGCEAAGKPAQAYESYARSLALNPANRNAVDRLKVLKDAAPNGKGKAEPRR